MRILLYILIVSFIVCGVIVIKGEIAPGSDPKAPLRTKYLTDVDLQGTINFIARYNRVEDKYADVGDEISPAYEAFRHIAAKASNEQLVKLTDHPIPCIKAYAFMALVERENSNCRTILEKHIYDTTAYWHKMERVMWGERINHYYLAVSRDILPNDLYEQYKARIEKYYATLSH